jgi:hypothetical protein
VQVRFGDAFSDAKRNLLVSMAVPPILDIPEVRALPAPRRRNTALHCRSTHPRAASCQVCIFFDDALFRGNRARKADSGVFHAYACFPTFFVLMLSHLGSPGVLPRAHPRRTSAVGLRGVL